MTPIAPAVKSSNLPRVTDQDAGERPWVETRPPDEVVGGNIRELREGADLTQRELADRLRERGWQIDPTALTRIEAGTRSVRVSQLFLIADALSVTVSELIADQSNVVGDLRLKASRDLHAARKYLVEGLSAVTQVAERTHGPQGLDLLAASGVSGAEPGWPYLDYVLARIDRFAHSNGTERVMVFIPDGDGVEERLTAIARSLISDLITRVGEDADGSYRSRDPERPDDQRPWALA